MKRHFGVLCLSAVVLCLGCNDTFSVSEDVSCNDGEKRCDDAGRVLTCSGNTWSVGVACPDGQVCQLGNCVDNTNPVETCNDGETRCDGAGFVQTCSGNTWGPGVACPEGQSCQSVSCADNSDGPEPECSGDASKCVGDELHLCIDGYYHKINDCSASGNTCITVSDTAMCSTCETNQTRCIDGGLQTCNNGNWGTAVPCKEGEICRVNEDGVFACMPECNDGQMVCEGNTLKTCNNGVWNKESCNDKICGVMGASGDMGCRECTEGETVCVDNVIKTCANGEMKLADEAQNCAAQNMYCDPLLKVPECKKDCEQGELKCSENKAQECDESGHWIDVEAFTCDGEGACVIQSDSDGKPKAVCMFCQPEQYRCGTGEDDKNKRYGCTADYQWEQVATDDCAQNPYSICEEHEGSAECSKCVKGSTMCGTGDDEAVLYTCNEAGVWKDTNCAQTNSDFTCLEKISMDGENEVMSYVCQECLNDGDTTCEGDTLKICENGLYGNPKNCSDKSQVCSYSIDTNSYDCLDECTEGTTRCDGDRLDICQNTGNSNKYHFEKKEDCTGNFKCGEWVKTVDGVNTETAMCLECHNGDAQCVDENKIAYCEDGRWKNEDGSWKNEVSCDANKVCSIKEFNKAECVDSVTCSSSDNKCLDESHLKKCEINRWIITECSGDALVCAEVTEGDATVERCVACIPNSTRCFDDGNGEILQICQADGTWSNEDKPDEDGEWSCGFDPGKGQDNWVEKCEYNVCASDNSYYKCENGKYQEKPLECVAETPFCNKYQGTEDKCESCQNDSTQCKVVEGEKQNVLQTCVNGTFSEKNEKICKGSKPYCVGDDGKAECVECVPGTQQCLFGNLISCDNDGNYDGATYCYDYRLLCGLIDDRLDCISMSVAKEGETCNQDFNKSTCQDANTLAKCVNGKVEYETCEKGICGDGNCVDKLEYAPDGAFCDSNIKPVCNGAKLVTCNADDQVQISSCKACGRESEDKEFECYTDLKDAPEGAACQSYDSACADYTSKISCYNNVIKHFLCDYCPYNYNCH